MPSLPSVIVTRQGLRVQDGWKHQSDKWLGGVLNPGLQRAQGVGTSNLQLLQDVFITSSSSSPRFQELEEKVTVHTKSIDSCVGLDVFKATDGSEIISQEEKRTEWKAYSMNLNQEEYQRVTMEGMKESGKRS